MGADLVPFEAVKEVSTLVGKIIKFYDTTKELRMRDVRDLRMQTAAILRVRESQILGQVIRMNIEQIAETNERIEQKNLTGLALELAMGQLRELDILLRENLNSFKEEMRQY